MVALKSSAQILILLVCLFNLILLGCAAQWCNDAPPLPLEPWLCQGVTSHKEQQIGIKIWDNFARFTVLLANACVRFSNLTIYLEFLAIFSEIAPRYTAGSRPLITYLYVLTTKPGDPRQPRYFHCLCVSLTDPDSCEKFLAFKIKCL